MKKWPLKIIQYLTGFLILSVLHCTVVGIVNGGDKTTVLYSIVYLPMIIMLSEAQKRTRYAWQYLVIAGLALGIIRFAYNDSLEKTLGTVFTVAAIFIYFYARAKKEESLLENPDYYFLALFLIIWFLERQYPSQMLEKYVVIAAGMYCLLCMYKKNLDEVMQIIDLNGQLERFPENRLLKYNLLMMGFQTIIVSGGMIAVLSTGVDGVLNKVSKFTRRIIGWLLSLLESDASQEGAQVSGGEMILPVADAGEKSALLELILKILDVLSWALVIGLTCLVLYKILKKFYQLYLEFDMNSAKNGDEIEKIYQVQGKEEKRKIKRQKAENLRWDRTPEAKIRKIYKKRVLKEWKEIPKPFMTPDEIEKNISMDNDNKKVFHILYEKARYANTGCSKEDVEQMKVYR